MDDLARARQAVHSKSSAEAYILWLLLAPLGIHRVYLGKLNGLAQPVLIVTGFVLLFRDEAGRSGIGTFLVACGLLWALADGFLIPGMVREYNRQLARSLTRGRPD